MKRIFICITLILCLLTATACSSLDTTLHHTWLTDDDPQLSESFTYEVSYADGMGTDTGVYNVRARKITPANYDASAIAAMLDLMAVDEDSKALIPLDSQTSAKIISELDEKGGYLLTSNLAFETEYGVDVMESSLVLSSTYRPLAMWKTLAVAAEQDQGYDPDKGYRSYVYSAQYTYNASATLLRYDAQVLHKTGATDTDYFTTSATEFTANVWDSNQIIYIMRSLNYTQSNFSYSYEEPAPLDGSLTSTTLKQIVISASSQTTDVLAKVNNMTPTSCHEIAMTLSNVAVQGRSALVYLTANDYVVSFNGVNVALKKVPFKIVQGDLVFLLTDVTLQ